MGVFGRLPERLDDLCVATETDILLLSDDLRRLVDACRGARLRPAVRAERRARAAQPRPARGRPVHRELETRQIDVVNDLGEDGEAPARAAAAPDHVGDDDRRAAALPARGGPPSAPDGRAGGRAREADRERRTARQAADDPVEPAPRRLDREELPQPGAAVPRPDPGRHARPDPRRREVRLAPRATSSRPTRPGGSARRSRGRSPTRHGRSACPSTSSSACRR